MSAICAVFGGQGAPAAAAHVASLLRGMCEYGDDGSLWSSPDPHVPIALGVIPWRVTAEDDAYRGPVTSPDGHVVLVADARIDNREELVSDLRISKADAAGMSDPALILSAYLAWERRCPERLVGDFAFVVWDGRRRELFAARDGMGNRVLFYHQSPGRLAVATTAHALTSLPFVFAKLDEQKVADFLVLLQKPETTFYEGIRRVPAGHHLTVTDRSLEFQRFWSPFSRGQIKHRSDREYAEGMLAVLQDAVRSKLRAAAPVAIMTSGGLDSTSVAAIAAEQYRERSATLPAFHAAPREGFTGAVRSGWVADETADVQAVARLHPNIELHIRRPDASTPFDDAETSFRMTGAPPRNTGNVAWFYGIHRLAQERGIRVMLVGNKGNATISHTGYRSLRDSAVSGNWLRVWREVNALGRVSGQGRRNILRRNVIKPITPHLFSALGQAFSRKPVVPVWDLTDSAIKPDFARAMQTEERVKDSARDYRSIVRMSDLEFRASILTSGVDVFDLYSGYRPWFGIETRDPTSDRRVIEYCFGVPGDQYLLKGEARSLVRRAMQGRLPEQVRTRTTIGAQAPDWIEWLPAMRGRLDEELGAIAQSETVQRVIDLPRLRGLMERWPHPMTVHHDREYYMRLLRGIMMGKYIRWFEKTYA